MKNESHQLFKVINSKVHGKGIIANEDIPKGTKIIEYVGNIVSRKEGERIAEEQYQNSKKSGAGAVYIFELNRKQDVDGNVSWNLARFINHSCDPNCKYQRIDNHIWIVSRRDIKKGEELSYDYGYDLEEYKNHPCKCKSKNCLGYIIGKRYWKKFERLNKESSK